MGNSNNTMYKDSDIPRDHMDILFGPSSGFSYYKCSTEGLCNNCQAPTRYWYVTIKSKGKFLCEKCHEKL